MTKNIYISIISSMRKQKIVLWKDLYKINSKPTIYQIKTFFSTQVLDVFENFTKELYSMNLDCIRPIYTKSKGWVLKYAYKHFPLITVYIIDPNCFYVGDLCIKNMATASKAIKIISNISNTDFRKNVEEMLVKKRIKQRENGRKIRELEKDVKNKFAPLIVSEKYNKFKWVPRVSQSKIRRLYKSSVDMRLDSELLDDIGYTFYTRCVQGKEIKELYHEGKLKCFHCGSVIVYSKALTQCECGYQYYYRDYMLSYASNKMPTGGAQYVYDEFIERWPKAKTDVKKMFVIDWLIHECHMNITSGAKRDFTGRNLIQGNYKEIKKLIMELAYE